jgi:hypothetical protein
MCASCLLWILVAGASPETPGVSAAPPAVAPATRQTRPADRSRQTAARRRTRSTTPRLAGAGSNAAQLIDLIQTTVAPDEWEPPAAIGIFGGGGGGPFGGGGGAGGLAGGGAGGFPAGLGTNTANLIELIQTTIEPFSWDVNGGPGSIQPFGP